MAWKQVRAFNVNKMGSDKGWCLRNVRLGFGIGTKTSGGKYPSAKADMEAQKKAGTLHDISTLPKNVAVPVYTDTSSQYEHIMVSDCGVFYSDKRKLTTTAGIKFFGWGELCDGTRVVEYVQDEQKKSNEEIAQEVVRGLWGNGAERKQRLEAAGYDYGAIQSIVDKMMGGNNSTAITYYVRKGDTLTSIANRYGTSWQKIAQDNGLKNPNLIFPSQRLKIYL